MIPPQLGASEAASALVRAWCGWHVAPAWPETLTLDTQAGSSLLLPTLRIQSVESCTLDGVDILDRIEWSADGMIRYQAFPRKFRALTISLTHGFDESAILPIVDRVASRLTTLSPGVEEETVGRRSVRYTSGGGGLLEEDRLALAPFKLNWGP